MEPYIKEILTRFKDDKRIHAWDLFNEPDNTNGSSYAKQEPANKPRLCLELLKKEFAWARAVDPSQPLTTGVWTGEWTEEKLSPMAGLQLEQSDVISFHDYSKLPKLKERTESLRRYGRPILCTEYMARPAGEHVRPVPRVSEGAARRRVQLGVRRRQEPDHLSLGLVEEAVRR